jgi:hypothetical protein
MSKPTTNENDTPVKPDITPRVVGKWLLPDNCVIVERTGEKFALVGPPLRRIEWSRMISLTPFLEPALQVEIGQSSETRDLSHALAMYC